MASRFPFHFPLCWVLLLVPAQFLFGAADSHELSFEKDIRPILKTSCFACHGEGKKLKGGLDLRLQHLIVQGGKEGTDLVPGKPEDSPIFTAVRDGDMPKGDKKLTPAQVSLIEKWVAQGAKVLRPEPESLPLGPVISEEERAFWAFQPIQRPAVPHPEAPLNKQIRTPIDAFVGVALKKAGLTFNPDADKQTLIRRATLDLIGLPPTPQEIEEFVADQRPDAYERLVDRLLASPQYGECWGRHWLDVAGYADSEGYNDADVLRPDAYLYRDYVIRSFNDDKPFDQFIREQLAGDEMVGPPPYKDLSPAQVEKLTATGFLRMVPDGTAVKNDDDGAARNAVMEETIKVVSTGLLGLTVGCAQCHDHRYDPITQRDYYRLRAVFEPALNCQAWLAPKARGISLATPDQVAESALHEKAALAIEAELKPKLADYQSWIFEQEVLAVPPEVQGPGREAGLIWQKDPKKLTPEQTKLLDTYPRLKVSAIPSILILFLNKYEAAKPLQDILDENAKRAAAERAKKPKEVNVRALTEAAGPLPVTHLFIRGDRNQPGDPVTPGDLTILHPDKPLDFPEQAPGLKTSGRRLAFAQHLTDGSNPLLARVLVNRFWLHHFGRGLVGTPGDFGTQGERPSHPELLDWLASEFMASGWNLKALQRLIMTSTVYRQGSQHRPDGDSLDAANWLLWRMPVRRLEAETIRDSILAISGKLNPEQYGPPVPVTVDENQQAVVGDGKPSADGREFRRSVYVQARRSQPAYMLNVFDEPQMEPNCDIRSASTVAPQSLLLMNSRFAVEQAEFFAERVRREAGGDPAAQVARAWQLAYGTAPNEAQRAKLAEYLAKQTELLKAKAETEKSKADPAAQALASLCQVFFGSNRLLYVE